MLGKLVMLVNSDLLFSPQLGGLWSAWVHRGAVYSGERRVSTLGHLDQQSEQLLPLVSKATQSGAWLVHIQSSWCSHTDMWRIFDTSCLHVTFARCIFTSWHILNDCFTESVSTNTRTHSDYTLVTFVSFLCSGWCWTQAAPVWESKFYWQKDGDRWRWCAQFVGPWFSGPCSKHQSSQWNVRSSAHPYLNHIALPSGCFSATHLTFCLFLLPPDGLATCTQATGVGSLSLSEEISSIGMTGRPPLPRSSLSDVCETCSGTRGAVSSFPTQLRLLIPTLPQHLLPLLLQLEPAEQDPRLPPTAFPTLPTVPALCLNLTTANAACAQWGVPCMYQWRIKVVWPGVYWWCCTSSQGGDGFN